MREWRRLFYLARIADIHLLARTLDQMMETTTTCQIILSLHEGQLLMLVNIINDVSRAHNSRLGS